jgi:hypothetical protein
MSGPSSPMRDALALVLAIQRGTWADLGDFNQVAADYGFTDAQAPLVRYLATLLARFDAGETEPGQLKLFARSLAGRDE